jgi:hypothetical protein
MHVFKFPPLAMLTLGYLSFWHTALLRRGPVSAILAILATAWCALIAAAVLSRISHALAEVRSLVMFPCFLLYGSFALLTVY